jgi:hypothetical protein
MSNTNDGRPPGYLRLSTPDEDLYAFPSKLPETANDEDRIKEQSSRKITPKAHAFITRMIVEGRTNKEINRRLRVYKYLSERSPDLTTETLRKIRRKPHSQRNPDLLDAEAQYIAHKSLSQAVYYMRDVMDHAYQRAVYGPEMDGEDVVSPGGLIFDPETKLSEVRSLLADAIKLLYSWYAKDIAKYTAAIGDDTKGVLSSDDKQSDILDGLVAATIREFTARKRRELEAKGYKLPEDIEPET